MGQSMAAAGRPSSGVRFTVLLFLILLVSGVSSWQQVMNLQYQSRTRDLMQAAARQTERMIQLCATQHAAGLTQVNRALADFRMSLDALSLSSQPVELKAPNTLDVETAGSAAEHVQESEDSLPPVPEGVEPAVVLAASDDLKAVVEDPRLNPERRELTRAERFHVAAEFKRAKALSQILDAEITAALTEGMEKLRERGDYVEYARGERYASIPGVLSAGEETETGGVRLFHFQPDEFRSVYEKRQERDRLPEVALGRVVAKIQNVQRRDG